MKFKYMIRGLGLGIIITAAVMGAYSRNAVADARVAVLKEYGLGEESRLVEEEESSVAEMTEPAIMRDEEREAEINSVLDTAKEAEQGGMAGSGETQAQSADGPSDEGSDTEASGADTSGDEASGDETPDADTSSADTSESSSAIVVTPSDEGAASGDAVEIVIASGDDSGTVARKLYNAGLIENASEYDAYLMQHGYDKRLSTGTKTISLTDDWKKIAEKITSK